VPNKAVRLIKRLLPPGEVTEDEEFDAVDPKTQPQSPGQAGLSAQSQEVYKSAISNEPMFSQEDLEPWPAMLELEVWCLIVLSEHSDNSMFRHSLDAMPSQCMQLSCYDHQQL
jgi:hypothetical protein